MLDFGTDMDSREEQEQNDDLFSGSTNAKSVEPNESPAVSAAVPEVKENKPPRRPILKPPVLPKYSEPQNNASAPAKQALHTSYYLHRRRKAEVFSDEDKKEVSRILKAARNGAGMTIKDVENATQIRAHYLTALEENDFGKLPQPVYVLAYLRKLCNLYDIPEDEEEQLVRPWREFPCELPENLPAKVVADDDNEPRKKVLRNLELALWAAGAVVAVGIIIGIVVLISSCVSRRNITESPFEKSRVLEIQPKPQLITPAIEQEK